MKHDKENDLSSPINRGKRLRYIREKMLDLSRRKFANRHKDLKDKDTGFSKITEDALHNWESARFKGLTEENAIYLIEAFKRENILCEKYWLLDGIGNAPILAGFLKNITLSKEAQTIKFEKELKVFCELYPEAVHVIVSDESLSPWYEPGDCVAGIPYYGKNLEKAVERPCIAKTETGEIVVKILKQGQTKHRFNLLSIHQDFNKEDHSKWRNIQLHSAAPIIWCRKPSFKD